MKKLKLIKLLVGIMSLSSLASCQSGTKIDYFSPKYAVVSGIGLEDIEKIGDRINERTTYDEVLEFLQKTEKVGFKKSEEMREHGVVCDYCQSWYTLYQWNKEVKHSDCQGEFHDCDLAYIKYADDEGHYFYVEYVIKSYSGEDIVAQK